MATRGSQGSDDGSHSPFTQNVNQNVPNDSDDEEISQNRGRKRSILFAEQLEDRTAGNPTESYTDAFANNAPESENDSDAEDGNSEEVDDVGMESPPTVVTADEHYMRGITCIRARDFTPAIHHFSKSIFLSPGEPLPYVARAEAYTHLCELRSAIANYRKALSLMRDPIAAEDLKARLAQVLDAQGIVQFRAGRVDVALRFINESLEEKQHPLVELHRCLCLIAKGNDAAATEQLQALVHDADAEADATVLLVQLHINKTDFAAGRKLLEGILFRFHDHPRVLDMERTFDTAFNSFKQEAEQTLKVESLTRCIEAFPEDAELYRVRAIAHANRKSYTLAVQDLFTCINKCGGSNPEAAALMGTMLCTIADELVSVADYVAAVNYYTEALKWDDEQLPVYIARGDCNSVLGKHEQALKDYKYVLDVDPHDEEAKFRLGRLHDTWGSVLYNQGKYQLAENEYTRALTYHDQNPVFFYHRALARLMLQNAVYAVRDLVSCRDLGATDPEIVKMINQFCKPAGLVKDQPPPTTSATPGQESVLSVRTVSSQKTKKKIVTSKEEPDQQALQSLRTVKESTLQGKFTPTSIRDSVRTTRISQKGNVMVVNRPDGKAELRDMVDKHTEAKVQTSASNEDSFVPNAAKQPQKVSKVPSVNAPVWNSSKVKMASRLDRAPVSTAEPIPVKYVRPPQAPALEPSDAEKSRMIDLTGNATRKAVVKPNKLRQMVATSTASCGGQAINDLFSSGSAAIVARPQKPKVEVSRKGGSRKNNTSKK